jgi:ribonucleoside-diphosphate reductase alpha chain
LIDAASRRQKWIDQSQSLNLYIDEPNGKKLDIMYRMAWLRGLKTTYYLRSRSATTAEKSTIATGELNAVSASAPPETPQPATTAPSACSVLDPDCDACQ